MATQQEPATKCISLIHINVRELSHRASLTNLAAEVADCLNCGRLVANTKTHQKAHPFKTSPNLKQHGYVKTIYIYMYIYIYTFIIYTSIYLCIFIFLYIFIYICIYTYIYIYIYIYIYSYLLFYIVINLLMYIFIDLFNCVIIFNRINFMVRRFGSI